MLAYTNVMIVTVLEQIHLRRDVINGVLVPC